MSISNDEQALQNLEAEKAAIENQSHNGYLDATRFVQIKSEIEAISERVAREKQRAEYGEG